MKPVKMLVTGAVITFIFCISCSAASKKQMLPDTGNGFAVLELFTSEGCSSCPPADALLARIQAEAGNKPVYILAYHVDYWNRLGWKDVFSDPAYSVRQQQYSRQLASQVYTPQLVINGQSEYIGSDAPAVSDALAAALNRTPGATVNIRGQQQEAKMDLRYQLTGNARNRQLLVAVVQRHASSQVKAGENEGRQLSHVQIVRHLYTFDLNNQLSGAVQIDLPAGFNSKDWELIGMVQQRQTRTIDAASRVAVSGI